MNTDTGNAQAVRALVNGRRGWLIVLPLARLALGFAAAGLVVAAGLGGYWMAAGRDGLERLLADPPAGEAPQATLDLPEMIVNLRAEMASRFLKIGITLVLAPQDRARVDRAIPHLTDALQDFLRNLDQKDLEGSAGLHRLRVEMRRRFNQVLGQDIVADVLLRSLLTQ